MKIKSIMTYVTSMKGKKESRFKSRVRLCQEHADEAIKKGHVYASPICRELGNCTVEVRS